MATRYQIGTSLRQTCALLGLSAERILRRVGLSASLADHDDLAVDAPVYFQVWEAAMAEAARPGVERDLAMSYAHGPFLPPVFAFSCADTLALGLSRLADFKPLIGPVNFQVTRPGGALDLAITASEPGVSMPPSMGLFELLYITECARCFSGSDVTPVELRLPKTVVLDEACLEHLGSKPKTGRGMGLTFAAKDADLPLITRSRSLWDTLEPGLTEQLEQQLGTASLSGRIRRSLSEALPGGSTTIEDMARRLNLSKRSLQRRLSEEGTSFQEVLNATRQEMSARYLKDTGLSVPEISYLLGFRDASSFFRAFHGWTGMTPGDFRASESQPPEPRIH